jgi:hypothetical protein
MKYLIILLMICQFLSCDLINGKQTDCIKNNTFEIPIAVSSSKKILKIGDTLTVSMVNDNTHLYDSNGDRIVYFPNFDPNAWFLMPLIDTFPVKDGFLENEVIIDENFETIHINVSTLSSGIFFLGINTMDLESKLEFKVILNTPGTYALYSVSEIHKNRKICFPNKCGGCGYNIGYIEGEFTYTSDINKDILNMNHLTNEDKYWEERSGQRMVSSPYYFRVVE